MSMISATAVRQTYLRGMDLGAAWTGSGGDAAIQQLLEVRLSQAEALMNIQFRRWRVATFPDPSLVAGQDYDILGTSITYIPPDPAETDYALRLGHHDVQAVTQLRFFASTLPPPFPPQVIDLAQCWITPWDELLHVPHTLVTATPTDTARWAPDYLLGLGRVPDEIAAWVSLGVAIQVLAQAGAGADLSHGLAGESLTMDDIREDRKYGGSSGSHGAYGGMYGPTMSALQYQLDDIDPVRLRFRYQGNKFPVVPS